MVTVLLLLYCYMEDLDAILNFPKQKEVQNLDIAVHSCFNKERRMPSFSPTTSLTVTLLKMIRGNLNGNPENFGNDNSGIIGDGNIVSTQPLIHVTCRDASLPVIRLHSTRYQW